MGTVEAVYGKGRVGLQWHEATINEDNGDGTYQVEYFHNNIRKVKANRIRRKQCAKCGAMAGPGQRDADRCPNCQHTDKAGVWYNVIKGLGAVGTMPKIACRNYVKLPVSKLHDDCILRTSPLAPTKNLPKTSPTAQAHAVDIDDKAKKQLPKCYDETIFTAKEIRCLDNPNFWEELGLSAEPSSEGLDMSRLVDKRRL